MSDLDAHPMLPEHIADGRDMAERVEELVRDGRPDAARRVFSQGWRDAVPELPERFPVRLRKLDRDLLGQIARRLVGRSQPPALRFDTLDAHTVVRSVDDDDSVIGQLKSADARYLTGLGEDAALYSPQLLEIGIDDAGNVNSVALSVVRPELRVCSSCTGRHADAHVNCADCRAKRRRKGPEEQSFEPAPVPFHEAVEAMTGQSADQADDPLAQQR